MTCTVILQAEYMSTVQQSFTFIYNLSAKLYKENQNKENASNEMKIF